jgi:hypothetical protein
METSVTRFGALCLLACVAVAGCGDDPARAVKIPAKAPDEARGAGARPAAPAPAPDAEPVRPTDNIVHRPAARGLVIPSEAGGRSSAADWRPGGCPPPAESGSGPDLFTVTGPCAFEHRAPVSCESTGDDFLVTMSRKGALGATVMIFINVEKYKGPDAYDGAQIFVGVQDKTNIYRWSSDELKITVGAGEQFVTLPSTKLEAEPLLVQCTGPMNNFQCGGRDLRTPIDGTFEIVSGTLRCEKGGRER